MKKTDFAIIGKQAQLQVAIALTNQVPDVDDYDNFPLPSTKQIAAEKDRKEREAREAEEEARKQEEQKLKEAAALQEAAKPKKKSTTKVEQVSPLTSEVVRVSYDKSSVHLQTLYPEQFDLTHVTNNNFLSRFGQMQKMPPILCKYPWKISKNF